MANLPSLPRSQVAMLGRRQQQPTKAPGELLAIWVSGKLVNPLNQGWGWAKHEHAYRRGWQERVALAVLEAGWRPHSDFRDKLVTFQATTHSAMDSDGLQAALKPVRDALVVCGVISGDADRNRHRFEYEQRIDRANRGVTIRVTLRAPASPSATRRDP